MTMWGLEDISIQTWVIAGLCVVLVGIAKAGFAGGIGVIAVPLLSLVMSPTKASAILLPLLCGCDMFTIYYYRHLYHRQNLIHLVPAGLVGIVIGSLTIYWFSAYTEQTERWMKVVIGIISILFVLYQVLRKWLFMKIEKYYPRPVHGWLMGTLAGYVSTLAHAGGPPITMYLLPQHLARDIFVGTTAWFFTIINVAKLPPYYWLGLFPEENLWMSLVLMPLVPVGVGLGVWLNRILREDIFLSFVYVILFLTGIQLLTDWNPITGIFR